jgi:hypothetical protein
VPRCLDPAVAKADMIAKGVWPVANWPGSSKKWLCVCMECRAFVTPVYRDVMRPGRGGCDPCGRLAAAANRKVSARAGSNRPSPTPEWTPLPQPPVRRLAQAMTHPL